MDKQEELRQVYEAFGLEGLIRFAADQQSVDSRTALATIMFHERKARETQDEVQFLREVVGDLSDENSTLKVYVDNWKYETTEYKRALTDANKTILRQSTDLRVMHDEAVMADVVRRDLEQRTKQVGAMAKVLLSIVDWTDEWYNCCSQLAEDLAQVLHYEWDGTANRWANRIAGIKFFRLSTGLGLKEAKYAVDLFCDSCEPGEYFEGVKTTDEVRVIGGEVRPDQEDDIMPG